MSDSNKNQVDIADLKDKLQPHPDVLETLTLSVRKRVEVLRELQGQHDKLEAKFSEERGALEAKYQKLYEPLYTKRYEIVNGVIEVEGVTNGTTKEEGEEKAPEEKGVPNFWVTAMKTHKILEDVITELDEGALKYLKDIKWARIDNLKGFKLEFFFDTNPYFKNEVLTKTYCMIDEDEPILEKAIGTEIEWYPGKCLTQKFLKKQPKKGSKNNKSITKTGDCDSFFNFFKPPEALEDDDDLDEDAAEELQALMEQDYEIGTAIRDKIIPHAVSWFTGEAAREDGFELVDEEDDDEEDEDDEDEEEDEDDDDDEDEEETKNWKKGGKEIEEWRRMEKRSKELLELEHKNLSSAEAALLICGNGRKLLEEKPKPDGKPFTAPPPKSQVLDRVRGFLGVISEANKNLQLNAESKAEDYNIEVLNGDESAYIEMDLMLGVADLHTSEAVAAAEAAIAGKQPVIDLPANASSSESESSVDEDDDDHDDGGNDDDGDKHTRDRSQTSQELEKEANSTKQQSKRGPKSKQPKIVELS